MEPTRELIDDIYRERVLRARKMSPEEKFLSGARLFEEVCQRMTAGLRAENPGADDVTLTQLLQRRLDLLERLRSSHVGQ